MFGCETHRPHTVIRWSKSMTSIQYFMNLQFIFGKSISKKDFSVVKPNQKSYFPGFELERIGEAYPESSPLMPGCLAVTKLLYFSTHKPGLLFARSRDTHTSVSICDQKPEARSCCFRFNEPVLLAVIASTLHSFNEAVKGFHCIFFAFSSS